MMVLLGYTAYDICSIIYRTSLKACMRRYFIYGTISQNSAGWGHSNYKSARLRHYPLVFRVSGSKGSGVNCLDSL